MSGCHVPKVVAESGAMRESLSRLDAFARYDVPVFLSGETGSGKELAARRLHAASRRRTRAFVAVNCASFPDSLLESELFGHTAGAFTGAQRARAGLLEQADGGTLFLDEVADLPPRAQTALLRVLQEKEYRRLGESALRSSDFRLVSASHKDLDSEVAAGRLRLDLLYRLRVARVRIPPLRERREDVVPLARVAVQRAARGLGLEPRELSRSAARRLEEHAWPGNVRELENEVVQALIAAQSAPRIGPEHLSGALEPRVLPLAGAARELEKKLLRDALATHGGNRSRTARALGLSRQGLYRKLKRLGVSG